MLDMKGTLKKFLRERELKVNVDKTKMIVFNRKRKEKKEKWLWEGKEIEEVQSFKYLGFNFNRKGEYSKHIRDLRRKRRVAANKVWGLGERMCKDDFNRRMMLCRYLVVSVMSYGAEIWGWEEKKELEKCMLDYTRWVYKLDFCTPRYIIRRELNIDKLRIEWGIRARRFEERIKELDESRWVKKCWMEKEERSWKELYGKERESYYNRNGWGREAEEVKESKNKLEFLLREREKDIQKQEIDSKLKEARYNRRYGKESAERSRPRYLSKNNLSNGNKGTEIRGLLRLRCGNMEEENKYWLDKIKRGCVFCNKGKDKLEHYVEECEKVKEWFRELEEGKEEIIERLWSDEIDEKKGEVIKKLWTEKEKILKEKRLVN